MRVKRDARGIFDAWAQLSHFAPKRHTINLNSFTAGRRRSSILDMGKESWFGMMKLKPIHET